MEVHDYRPPKATDQTLEEPHKTRVVLSPNSETLWADICLMNQKEGNTWTDRDALEVEARILVRLTMLAPCPLPDRTAVGVHSTSTVSRPGPTPYPHRQQCTSSFCTLSSPVSEAQGRCRGTRRSGDGEGTQGKIGALHEPQIHSTGRVCPKVSFNYVSTVKFSLIGPVSSFRVLEALQRYRMMKAQQATAQASQASATAAPAAAPGYGAPTVPTAPASAVPSSYGQPSVPMPPAVPPAIAIQPPPITAPAQPMAASGAADAAKRQGAGVGIHSPAQVPRTSATPVQQIGHAPTAIPPHLQPHAAQMAHRTPPRTSQSPHPPQNGASSASTPPGPDARPPSAMQRPPSQPNHAAAPPRPPSVRPVGAQPAHAQYQGMQQQAAANVKLAQNMIKKSQQQAAANGMAAGAFPQGAQPGAAPGQAAMPYYPYYQYPNAAQQRLNQPGQSATPVTRSPMNSSQGSTPQHSSPLAASQRLTTQSPRPGHTQQTQAQVQVQAAQAQVQTQPGQQAAGNYTYATLQHQYPAQFRPQAQGHPPQAPLVPHHAAHGAPAGSVANPQAAQRAAQQPYLPQPYMYYPVQNYWPIAGRGAPVANGQVQLPNISAHTQQVQMNANKAVQGGVQGS